MAKRTLSRVPAVLIHDGVRWSLPGDPGQRLPGAPNEPPEALLAALAQTHRSVRFLLSCDLRRAEITFPPRLRRSERHALLAQEMADRSGADSETLLCTETAGGAGASSGVLMGAFGRGAVEALWRRTEAAGLRFGGVAALELACLAAWRRRSPTGQSLVLVGQGQMLVVPPPPGEPTPAAGGLRHAADDIAGWLTRFARGAARSLHPETPLRVVALGEDAMGRTLTERLSLNEGFAAAQSLPSAPLLAEAAHLVAGVRPNRAGEAVPLENPHEPRKRFSNGWIVAPCAVLLALPFLYGWAEDLRLSAATRRYQREATRYLPLEKTIQTARARKEAAQRALSAEENLQRTLAERRRPLAAFIHAAYFFCRHARASVLLESLEERDGRVTARGTFADREDGVRMEAALLAFAAEVGLRVAETSVSAGNDAEGLPLSRFVYVLDSTYLGEKR